MTGPSARAERTPSDHGSRVRPLVDALSAEGWCLFDRAVSPSILSDLVADLEPHFANTLFSTGGFYGERTKRFGRLLVRSEHAAALVAHPDILALVETILGAWCDVIQLNLTQAIEIHPGALPQLPHRDQDMWQGIKGEVEYLVNVMWPLTPFTEANGATLIHPRSHGAAALEEGLPQTAIPIECVPGSAIVFLGSTLHGAGGNRTALPRRGIIVSYCLGWLKPYENQWLAYPPSTARRFAPALAALIGYRQHRPNLGNIEGLCPSVLLRDGIPDQAGAVDALRPEQAELVAGHVARQRSDLLARGHSAAG
jgi:ectoine hydroxylase-related dioxygenase (phytanoyl-CoA dioxygenase family)